MAEVDGPDAAAAEAGATEPGRQELKAQATRAKLCHATMQVISDVGYHRATTTMIAKAAGVSRGAQTHHYPNKIDLVVAAFDALLSEWYAKDLAFTEGREETIEVAEYLTFVWQTVFNHPHYVAALEIMLARQGDPQLGQRLEELMAGPQRSRLEPWRAVFSTRLSPEQQRIFSDMTVCLFRGMAMQFTVSDGSRDNLDELLKTWIDLVAGVARKPGDS